MVHLLIGPSNSGKSTWIGHQKPENVGFAFQFRGDQSPPDNCVLHYNLLFLAPRLRSNGDDLREWDILGDPFLDGLLREGKVDRATVIVAPVAELLARADARDCVEASIPDTSGYNSAFWQDVLKSVDHFAMYQNLFDVLEKHEIPYEVLFNSQDGPANMPQTDRCYVHAALRGTYVPVPTESQITRALKDGGAEYQSIRLPKGVFSDTKGFGHTNGPRRQSFDIFRDRSLVDSSVLDIGCAMGDILYWYERFGATRLVGLDIKEHRLNAARKFAGLLHSNVTFLNADFLTFDSPELFDDVLALNVLHHVADIRGFLEKACALTAKRLIIEYPLLSDPKFQRLGAVPADLDDLPLIGVSSKRIDQTFVFTTAALERLVADFGSFSLTTHPSPIADRKIAVFTRND